MCSSSKYRDPVHNAEPHDPPEPKAMTIANERLVDYLGLEFELCYVKPSGEAVWILADKIRRKDVIALEMLRIFNRFMRIGKSLDRVNERRGKKKLELPGRDDNASVESSPGNPSNNAPYAHCIGVRIRVQEHIAAFHVRPGFDPKVLTDAPRLSSGALLDANVQLQLDDPILSMLTTASNESTKSLPSNSPSTQRPRRPKSND